MGHLIRIQIFDAYERGCSRVSRTHHRGWEMRESRMNEGVGWQSFWRAVALFLHRIVATVCLKVCQRSVSVWCRESGTVQRPRSLFFHPSNSDISCVSLIPARLRTCIREEDVFCSLVAETRTQFAIRPGFFRHGSRKVRVCIKIARMKSIRVWTRSRIYSAGKTSYVNYPLRALVGSIHF